MRETSTSAANTDTRNSGGARLVAVEYRELGGQPDALAVITLNRPEKLNALTLGMLRELRAATAAIRRRRSVRAVIVRGADHTFSAGLDFGHALRSPAQVARAFIANPTRGTNLFQEAPWGLRRLGVPVIAAIEGYCYGGGVQIALAADWRVTTADARWAVLEAKWGLIPDMSGMQALSELVGRDVATRLAMTGEEFSGEQAVAFGLASEVAADPFAAAVELAELVATRSPDSVAMTKRVLRATWGRGERLTFLAERWGQVRLLAGRNAAEARKAAMEKRAPRFRR